AVADCLGHVGLVLDDQHAHAPMLEPACFVGISKTGYGPETRRFLEWRHDVPPTGPNEDAPDLRDPVRRPARGDRGRPRLPAAAVLALAGRSGARSAA